MLSTLQDFVDAFIEIKNRGWVQAHRSGPTGIGKTLEDLLGIVENNSRNSDFGEYELKSTRIGTSNMLTLFTKSPEPSGTNMYLRNKYGYCANDCDGKKLHVTLSTNDFTNIADTEKKLKILCDDKIYIISQDYEKEAYWDMEVIKQAFEQKFSSKIIYVKALARKVDNIEEFKFTEAYEISHVDYDLFLQMLRMGKIYVDIRIGEYHTGKSKGKTHDHGSGFRIREDDQKMLFRSINRIA